jgi:hypothetical protein
MREFLAFLGAAAVVALTVGACGSGSGSDPNTAPCGIYEPRVGCPCGGSFLGAGEGAITCANPFNDGTIAQCVGGKYTKIAAVCPGNQACNYGDLGGNKPAFDVACGSGNTPYSVAGQPCVDPDGAACSFDLKTILLCGSAGTWRVLTGCQGSQQCTLNGGALACE